VVYYESTTAVMSYFYQQR